MRRILLVMFIFLFTAASVFCGEFEDTLKKAEQGDVSAQFDLGEMYADGQGVAQDFKKAVFWIKKAAEQGHPQSQFAMGVIHVNHKEIFPVPQDFEQAIYWYRKAAEQGHVDAQWNLGAMYHLGAGIDQDIKKAFYWYEKAAKNENKTVSCHIGDLFYDNFGVPVNMEEAVFWYEKAVANNCDPLGFICRKLGLIYYEGSGVDKDYKKAKHYFHKAIDSSTSIKSHYYLGEIYYNGFGLPPDFNMGVYHYLKAIKFEFEFKIKNLTPARNQIIQILDDIDSAKTGDVEYWLNLGAKLGYIDFQFDIAWHHYLKDNYKQAFYWYDKLAKKGHPYAMYMVGELYDFGRGVEKNDGQAFYWYEKSAWQGNASAMRNLAIKYANGEGALQNYRLAYAWSSLAAKNTTEYFRKPVVENRDFFAKKLSPKQLVEAQDLAAKIQYQIDNPTESQTQPPVKTESGKIIGSGTGFFITKDGHILTCLHVVQDASRIEIHVGDKMYPASLIRSDSNNDLAILKVTGSFPALAFSPHRSAKIGQDVFTFGYPNPGLQGISAKYTKGTISSLTGFQDDLRLYQISIPIQPGNSGGALLDEYGNILGIVVAMLSAKTTFQVSGSLPQNVNYAVKSLYAQAMIDTMPGVAGKLLAPSRSKANAIDNAQQSTVMVVCYD